MIRPHQLDAALQIAPPGSTISVITEMRITLPAAAAETEKRPPVELSVGCQESLDAATRTPLERLRASRGLVEVRKEKEWVEALCRPSDFSGRELDRACKHGVLAWYRKDGGKDAGARMISYRDLEDYLLQREQVQQGKLPPPSWWAAVVTSLRRARS